MMWLIARRTGDAWWRATAEHYSRLLEHKQHDRDVHDLGFIFLNTYLPWYELTGDDRLRDVLITAGRTLALRFNPKGRYLRSFVAPESLFIDIMMNVPIIFYAARETGDRALYDLAVAHCRTTERTIVRPDGGAACTRGRPACRGRCASGAPGRDRQARRGQRGPGSQPRCFAEPPRCGEAGGGGRPSCTGGTSTRPAASAAGAGSRPPRRATRLFLSSARGGHGLPPRAAHAARGFPRDAIPPVPPKSHRPISGETNFRTLWACEEDRQRQVRPIPAAGRIHCKKPRL